MFRPPVKPSQFSVQKFFPAPLKYRSLISKICRQPLILFRSRGKFSVLHLRNYFSRQHQQTLTDLPGEERKNPSNEQQFAVPDQSRIFCRSFPFPHCLMYQFLNCFYSIIFTSFFRFCTVLDFFRLNYSVSMPFKSFVNRVSCV